MHKLKMICAALIGAAVVATSGEAAATVKNPDPVEMLPFALPGISLALGGIVTTTGTAFSFDDDPTPKGWATSSITLGAFNMASAGVYSSIIVAAQDDWVTEAFLPTAIGNFAVGVASLSVGIYGAVAADEEAEALAVVPSVSFDAEGRPFVAVVGTFY